MECKYEIQVWNASIKFKYGGEVEVSMIKIGNNEIGITQRPYFIADIAANHDGDLKRAYKLIELAKESGADAAKFQNFRASTLVSKNGFEALGKRVSHQSSWQKPVYEVYEDYSIKKEWTSLLKKKCEEFEIEYLTTPYDFEAVDQVEPYVNAYKIGSGDITWIEFLEYVVSKNKPVLLSTGASSLEDVDRAVNVILSENNKLILMQCNTNYTASIDNLQYVNLNVLKKYTELYPEVVLGLSDHTPGHVTVLGAIALGARVIEKHFTDDNDRVGPDHKFSMNPVTWREMIDRSTDLWKALGDGQKKIEANEKETAIIQRRSLYYSISMKEGSVLTKAELYPLRPCNENGIPPYEMNKVIGKTLRKDVEEDTCIRWEDLKETQV